MYLLLFNFTHIMSWEWNKQQQ